MTRTSFMIRPETFQSCTYRLPSLSQYEPCVPLKMPSIHWSCGTLKFTRLAGIGVVAEHGDDRVALVENDQPPVQVGHGDVVALDGGGGRHAQAGHDLVDEVAVEVVVQQAALGLRGCGRRSTAAAGRTACRASCRGPC